MLKNNRQKIAIQALAEC